MSDQLRYSLRLFFTLTWTTFKMRYYGSFLGYIWSLLRPLALFGVLYIVFTFFLKQSSPHYKLFLLLGIILWTFFAEATTLGMNGFIGNYTLIRKVYLPRIILVASAVSSAFLGLFFNLIVFTVFAILDGIHWNLQMLWFIPLLLALYFLVLGIGLILSILVVKIRDTQNLWEVAVQLGFWLTPVMYPMSNVPEKFRFLVFLNPMSGVLEYSRYYLVGIGSATNIGYFYVMAISVALLAVGVLVFKWKEGEMVEDL
jgi:ABC-type polysaccharide/polyol phosphate export permease